jgi:hypothetical protein
MYVEINDIYLLCDYYKIENISCEVSSKRTYFSCCNKTDEHWDSITSGNS